MKSVTLDMSDIGKASVPHLLGGTSFGGLPAEMELVATDLCEILSVIPPGQCNCQLYKSMPCQN